MTIIYKPGVYTYVHFVKFLCRFVVKHGGSLRATLATVLDPGQLTLYDAAVGAISALCVVFDAVYPNIKA